MEQENIHFLWGLLLGFLLVISVINLIDYAHADSIHIDDYRPIGREANISIISSDVIHNKFQYIQTNVTVSINNMNYTGETNKYGYIAFPIKLTDNVFEAGKYDVLIQIGKKIYHDTLTVINRTY
ncbi:hypothetical protein [Nitrososphaeria virus YSH_462411]|uniref:Uncharacterized protein n=1 Tax=Nitrososphaeria virus YSH_462411 TaxID=3071321 RepID=A0A976YEX0_9CAUD|nr:hypothetical protein QKV92_gp18 [Yangshan Harbor Nitrososphaeria virus]UVF62290.1 hypothetical protein [Nitrososphaeria virus YSH_462411]